jgi:hypothetical protein
VQGPPTNPVESRYRLCGVQGIEAAVSRAVRNGLGPTSIRNRVAR